MPRGFARRVLPEKLLRHIDGNSTATGDNRSIWALGVRKSNVTIVATANDNVGVTRVEFLVYVEFAVYGHDRADPRPSWPCD
jgi:hypothetical protein